jgi:hypothetical protein
MYRPVVVARAGAQVKLQRHTCLPHVQREHCSFWTVVGWRCCHSLGGGQRREGAIFNPPAASWLDRCCLAEAVGLSCKFGSFSGHQNCAQVKAVVVENTFTSIEDVAPRLFPLLGLFIGPQRCRLLAGALLPQLASRQCCRTPCATEPVQRPGGSTFWCATSGRASGTSSTLRGSQCCCCPPSRSAPLYTLLTWPLHRLIRAAGMSAACQVAKRGI